MVSGEKDGKSLPEQTIKTAKLVIKGDQHDFRIGDETFKGTLKVDPSKKPKTIDATDTEGPFKGKTLYGHLRTGRRHLQGMLCQTGRGPAQGVQHQVRHRAYSARLEEGEEVSERRKVTPSGD